MISPLKHEILSNTASYQMALPSLPKLNNYRYSRPDFLIALYEVCDQSQKDVGRINKP